MPAAAVTVLAVTFVFFARGWIGGGDAKLAAATALWLGFDHLVAYLLYASIFGGVLTLAMIQFRLMPLPQAAGRAGMGEAPAPARRRRALWHRARSRGAADLSGHPLDAARLTERLPRAAVRQRTRLTARVGRRRACRARQRRFSLKTFLTRIWIRTVNHELTFSG